MSLEIRYVPEIVEDRRSINSDHWRKIESKIAEVKEEGKDHEKVKLIPNPQLKHAIWELKIEDENLDYRVFFDIKSNRLVVLGVWGFEFTHSGDQHWQKLKQRM